MASRGVSGCTAHNNDRSKACLHYLLLDAAVLPIQPAVLVPAGTDATILALDGHGYVPAPPAAACALPVAAVHVLHVAHLPVLPAVAPP